MSVGYYLDNYKPTTLQTELVRTETEKESTFTLKNPVKQNVYVQVHGKMYKQYMDTSCHSEKGWPKADSVVFSMEGQKFDINFHNVEEKNVEEEGNFMTFKNLPAGTYKLKSKQAAEPLFTTPLSIGIIAHAATQAVELA